MAWHNLTVPDASPKVAATLAGLGDGDYDGHVGIIRIGTYPDIHAEEFVWNLAEDRWIGTVEHMVMTSDDNWANDMTRQPVASFDNAWCRFNGGVGWEIIGARAKLGTAVTFNSSGPVGGVIDVIMHNTFEIAAFASAGQVLVRDILVSYTSTTDTGISTGTLNGCTAHSSHSGRSLEPTYTSIIPYATVGGGDPGGWGTSIFPMDRVGEMWAAGFRLQERMNAWLNGSCDLKYMQVAAFYLNKDLAENYNELSVNLPPPVGILGPGITLQGPAYDIAGYVGTGTHNKTEERGFELRHDGWDDWVSTAPTKRYLIPALYGRMQAGAKDNGEVYAVSLALRWVSP